MVTPLFTLGQEPMLNWCKTFGGIGLDKGTCVHADANGNVIIGGTFNGIVDFDPGPDTSFLGNASYNDGFILKLDSNGGFVWVRKIRGPARISDLTTDSLNNIYVTGSFKGTVDFSNGPLELSRTSNGDADLFVMKLSDYGLPKWIQTIGGPDIDEGKSIEIDKDANVIVTSIYNGLVDLDPTSAMQVHTSLGGYDFSIHKFDSDGTFIWAKTIGSPSSIIAFDVAVNSQNDLYFVGRYSVSCDFDPGPSSHVITTLHGDDYFVLKLDGNGDFIWVKTITGLYSEIGYALDIDQNDRLYVAGHFSLTVDFDPGPSVYELTAVGGRDIFVQKLESNGDFIWANSIGTPQNDYCYGIVADQLSNSYIVGKFGKTDEVFIQKLNPYGEWSWSSPGPGSQVNNSWDLAMDVHSNLYITGYFAEDIDLDPAVPVQTYSSNGSFDAYVCKLGTGETTNPSSCDPQNFILYPNPAHSTLMIQCLGSSDPMDLEIYNAIGQLVMQKHSHFNQNFVDISRLSSGPYLIKSTLGNKVLVKRFVKP